MKFDGLRLLDGSEAYNLTINTGSTFPDVPNIGELFYKTGEGLHIYDGVGWNNIALLESPTFVGDVSIPNLTVTGSAVCVSSELTDAATIAWDWVSDPNATVVIEANRILGNPTNATIGQYCVLRVDRTGNYILSFDTAYRGITNINQSSVAGQIDHFVFRYDGVNFELTGYRSNIGA
jgi:hypothetical protein